MMPEILILRDVFTAPLHWQPWKARAQYTSDRHSGTQPICSTVVNLTTVIRDAYHLSTHSTSVTIRVNSVKWTINTDLVFSTTRAIRTDLVISWNQMISITRAISTIQIISTP